MAHVIELLIELARNVSLLALIVVGYAAISRYAARLGGFRRPVLGILFGVGAVMAMATTVVLPSGIFIDGRNILMVLAPIFGGWVGGVIALAVGGAYRIWLGGPYVIHAVFGICIALAVGLAVAELYRRKDRPKGPADFLTLGLVVALESVMRLMLFRADAATSAISLAILVVIPLGTLVLGLGLHAVDLRLALEKQLQDETRRANQASTAKSWFLASMSHELRTPLNGILGFSEIIRDQTFGPAEGQRYAEYGGMVHKSGQHLLALINDILDLSKIEAGKMELVIEPLEPDQLAKSAVALIGGMAKARGVELTAHIDPECAVVHLDQRAAKQMLVNLLSNAVKFTPAGGDVELKIGRDRAGGIEIAVRDTGIGMTPDEAKVALENYGQIRPRLSSDTAGTGLGLPLVKAVAELHGGSIEIVSARGQGTTVSLHIPDAVAA